ncbi:adhesion G-protein coupled receptor D1-like isoform X2 [Montipora capricornis]|uniref:adhesion G-protein coupled receptor D1-like isoform X2 n=1 Tax=Montipora capricornis TaxID=246305 RepID=UPI0035F1E6B4
MQQRRKDIKLFFLAAQVILCISLCYKGPEKVRSERWFNITGSNVSDHTTSPVFRRQANEVKYLSCFEETVPKAPNYLGRYRSYLLPNETGNFTFFTFCDDTCQLFLSSGINPRNKRLIIHQTQNVGQASKNCCRNGQLESFQISVPHYLKENKLYYIELLIKNGQGNGRVSVGMRTPSGETKLPISEENLLKSIAEEYIPDEYCAEAGDSRYPNYIVDCNEFPDSVKVDKAIAILKKLQALVENKMNPSPDFLRQIMETAAKRTSALLESLNDSFVEENVNRSNRGFEIAREVEKLGESIASRIPNASKTIAVNYSSIYMNASKREGRFVFVAKSSKSRESGLQDSITITLGNTSASNNTTIQGMAYFFSAFYKNLEKAIQHNISHIHGENPSSKPKRYFLNSKIISGAVSGPSNESFQGEVTIKLRHTKYRSLEKMTMQCVFWRYSNRSNDSTGVWSSDGCYKDAHLSNDQATVCRSNHLAHFAILIHVTDDPEVIVPVGKSHRKALEIITYVGCGLSLLGEVLTILTLTFLKLTRSETSMIHLNLVVALATAQIIFLTGIEATQNKAACKIVAVLLHYFNLVSFTWMLTEGIWLYVMIVRVFENGHSRIKKYCACAWGIPFVFVVITLSACFDGYGTETSCWLSVQKGTIWSFVVPVLLIAVANSIILGMVMREILRLNEPTTKENLKYQSVRSGVQSAIVLFPLLGITWIFGILTFNNETVAFQYLFGIFNSLQGFSIFLFHCLLNSEVRRVFHSKKKISTESRSDNLQTNSLSPQNYNDIPKETLSSRSMRPGSGGSTASNLTQKPST